MHGFTDTINSICISEGDIESYNYFFLHCSRFSEGRSLLLSAISRIIETFFSENLETIYYLRFLHKKKIVQSLVKL